MIRQDLATILWKESKSLFKVRGRRSQFIMLMVTPLLLAVIFPIQMGRDWLGSGLNLIVAMVVPLLFVGTSIPDSFAGERERHTLSTLLASRLSDRVIFFGKMATSIIFGWGMTLVFIVLSTMAVNIATWDGQIHLYAPSLLIGNVVLAFLISLVTAGAGVLFSLRASTVQQAQQTLMAVLMIPLLIVQGGFFIILGSQSGRDRFREIAETISVEVVILAATIVLAVLAGTLLWAASRRFRREQLILS